MANQQKDWENPAERGLGMGTSMDEVKNVCNLKL
jgi:hypothetical protein